jgi:hypothetical protein
MKKKLVSKFNQKISLDVICYKLTEIHKDVQKNSKDIEDLKHQMSMGKGGIKAVFVVGSLIALMVGILKFYKF